MAWNARRALSRSSSNSSCRELICTSISSKDAHSGVMNRRPSSPLLYWGMDDLIVWLCLQLGSSNCYILSTGEKAMYLAGVIVGLMAAVLLFYGTLIRFFTR